MCGRRQLGRHSACRPARSRPVSEAAAAARQPLLTMLHACGARRPPSRTIAVAPANAAGGRGPRWPPPGGSAARRPRRQPAPPACGGCLGLRPAPLSRSLLSPPPPLLPAPAGVGIYGTKAGMMQFYKDGASLPATVIALEGGNVVTQVKTAEKDGYTAVQVRAGSSAMGGAAGSSSAARRAAAQQRSAAGGPHARPRRAGPSVGQGGMQQRRPAPAAAPAARHLRRRSCCPARRRRSAGGLQDGA